MNVAVIRLDLLCVQTIRAFAIFMPYEVSKPSLELIDKLRNADWLANCGREPNVNDVETYKFVSKLEAGRHLLSSHWDDSLINARNGCSSVLGQSELKRWNDIAGAVRSALVDSGCLRDATNKIAEHFRFKPSDVELVVTNYFHFACVELEYDGFLKPGFFAELCHICLHGRLPCGMIGDFPSGMLVVY